MKLSIDTSSFSLRTLGVLLLIVVVMFFWMGLMPFTFFIFLLALITIVQSDTFFIAYRSVYVIDQTRKVLEMLRISNSLDGSTILTKFMRIKVFDIGAFSIIVFYKHREYNVQSKYLISAVIKYQRYIPINIKNMQKAKAQSSIEISTTPEKVFNYLTNPNNIPLILPGLIENTNVPDLPLNAGSVFNYKYQMYGIMLEGEWTVTEITPSSSYKAHTTGGAESDWAYEITGEDGKTRVKLTIEYVMPESVLSKIKTEALAKINEKEAEHLLHNLKTVLEMQV